MNKIKPSQSDGHSLNPQSSILNPFQDLKETARLFTHSIQHRTENKVLAIGFGNTLREDDGIGPKIIEALHPASFDGMDFLVGGSDVFFLLDLLNQYSRIVMIDAVNMGEPAGTVKCFMPQDVRIKKPFETRSTHGFGLAELLKCAEQLGAKTELVIIGIQPGKTAFGEELSQEIQRQWPSIVEQVETYLRRNNDGNLVSSE